ncbi:MAG: type 4a pilus biogenesis protein PilO [Elusimicrobiales bacterium]
MAEQRDQASGELAKIIAASVMFCGMFGFGYWKFLWKPYAARKADAVGRVERINQEISKAKGMAAKLEPLNAEIRELRLREADAEKRLPKGRKLPDMIRSLTALARDKSVFISAITPLPTREQVYYTEIPYALTITGGYHAVGRFLAEIATSQRIFTVRDVNMSVAGAGIQASFVLVAYQYKG